MGRPISEDCLTSEPALRQVTGVTVTVSFGPDPQNQGSLSQLPRGSPCARSLDAGSWASGCHALEVACLAWVSLFLCRCRDNARATSSYAVRMQCSLNSYLMTEGKKLYEIAYKPQSAAHF